MNCPHKNCFCYVCGLFSPKTHARNITPLIIEALEGYFLMKYRSELWYVPEIICDYCHRALCGWTKHSHRLKYVQPMVYLHRDEHSSNDCYFCVNYPKTHGHRYHSRDQINYEFVPSVIAPRLRTFENLRCLKL